LERRDLEALGCTESGFLMKKVNFAPVNWADHVGSQAREGAPEPPCMPSGGQVLRAAAGLPIAASKWP
jgi:hypothetical protein